MLNPELLRTVQALPINDRLELVDLLRSNLADEPIDDATRKSLDERYGALFGNPE